MTPLISEIAVSAPVTVWHDGKEIRTGIFKSPVAGRVSVTRAGIVGDGQADLTVHGGRDKAVYVYPQCHYPTWASELAAAALEPGQFGENLTVTAVSEATVNVGDRFRFGSVVAVVSQPRLPCFKLGIRMRDNAFPQRFLQSGRLGFYLRIEEEGETEAGDAFALVEPAAHGITVTKLWETVFAPESTSEMAQCCLDLLPYLDAGWQRRLRQKAGR